MLATTSSALLQPPPEAIAPEDAEAADKFVCFWNGRLISQTRLTGYG